MKRFFIGITALALCVVLAGCGNEGGEMTLNSLGNQLDETSNIISSVQTVNPSDINMTKNMLETIASSENSAAIYDNMIGTQQSLLNEEYYKTDILSRTAKLKNNLSKNLKLSKAQTTAIKELTSNLGKYSNSVAYTQNDMSSTLRQISSLKKNAEKNADKINAKLNRLACNSNARSSYYENIIFTLSQIENYLNVPQDAPSEVENKGQTQTCPNCSAQMQNEKCENCGYDSAQPQPEQNINAEKDVEASKEENVANNPYTKFNSNNINRANFAFGATPYGGFGTNAFGGYGMNGFGGFNGFGPYGMNGMNGFGAYGMNGFGGYGAPYSYGFGTPYAYGGMNGNNINFARFNPNRNTDTYAPFMRNIDTYRAGTQANVQPVNNKKESEEKQDNKEPTIFAKDEVTIIEPEQRLEDFEEVDENNLVQKQEERKETLLETTDSIKEEPQNPNFDQPANEENLLKTSALLKEKQKNYDPPAVAY